MASKYHAHKITTPEGVFDSRREWIRWLELQALERAGEISQLHRQQSFELIPVQREEPTIGVRGGVKQGKVIERACYYIADYTYLDKAGNMVVEDCKGFRTKEYQIKRKLLLYRYGFRIKET